MILLLLVLLQEVAEKSPGLPEANVVAILGVVITTLLSFSTWSMKGSRDDMRQQINDLKADKKSEEDRHQRELAIERARTEKAEKREDTANDQLKMTVSTVTDLSGAVKEFATVSTSTVQEVKRNGERVETLIRRQDNVDRKLDDLTYRNRSFRSGETTDER